MYEGLPVPGLRLAHRMMATRVGNIVQLGDFHGSSDLVSQ